MKPRRFDRATTFSITWSRGTVIPLALTLTLSPAGRGNLALTRGAGNLAMRRGTPSGASRHLPTRWGGDERLGHYLVAGDGHSSSPHPDPLPCGERELLPAGRRNLCPAGTAKWSSGRLGISGGGLGGVLVVFVGLLLGS